MRAGSVEDEIALPNVLAFVGGDRKRKRAADSKVDEKRRRIHAARS
jgi:hypothetical protein